MSRVYGLNSDASQERFGYNTEESKTMDAGYATLGEITSSYILIGSFAHASLISPYIKLSFPYVSDPPKIPFDFPYFSSGYLWTA